MTANSQMSATVHKKLSAIKSKKNIYDRWLKTNLF